MSTSNASSPSKTGRVIYLRDRHTISAAKRSTPSSARSTAWGLFLPGQSASGYGSRITTDILIKLVGETRWRRCYATCFSNGASHWLLVGGEKMLVDTQDLEGKWL